MLSTFKIYKVVVLRTMDLLGMPVTTSIIKSLKAHKQQDVTYYLGQFREDGHLWSSLSDWIAGSDLRRWTGFLLVKRPWAACGALFYTTMQLSFWKEPPPTVSQFIPTRLTSHSYSLTATLIFLSSWIFLQPEKFFPPVSPLKNRLVIAPLINTGAPNESVPQNICSSDTFLLAGRCGRNNSPWRKVLPRKR